MNVCKNKIPNCVAKKNYTLKKGDVNKCFKNIDIEIKK